MAFSRRETGILLAGDFLFLVGALWFSLVIRNIALPQPDYFLNNAVPFIPIFFFSLAVFYIAGLYEKPTRPNRHVMGERIIGAQIANTILAAVFFFVLPLSIAPKTILALYLVVSVVIITAWRFYALSHFAPRGKIATVLVGTGTAVEEVAEELSENDRYTVRMVSKIDTATHSSKEITEEVSKYIRLGAGIIIIDTLDRAVTDVLPALYEEMLTGTMFITFEEFYEELFDRVPLAHVDYSWLLDCLPRQHLLADATKRFIDIIGALIGGVLALAFIAPSAVILTITGGRPFIFHERIGRNGKTFRIIKMRTMLLDDHGDPKLQAKNRITRIGGFLRKTRIDELPQLWNVFVGELSFIGPRPELPRIATTYEKEIPYYHARHLIKPGLSGWAQIRDYDAPRGGADVEKTRSKLSYDLYYLKHRSFGLDLAIALKTLRALASFSGS
ncbi:Undecaprenyl-phosphate galactosephosphotransferase [hydrothermal vent metagenome]|uniref:Undecaprenyl-phosphate galactosephosphotransferase n=1 Tax=hydrothermal vent metagenome TaxID=652676 RepID=A0A3B0UW01_9ZZZZ